MLKVIRHTDKSGFTLIELLVVIAIIAILVGFVASNFLGARQRAKDIKKKSELVQMKNALRLYYNDFNMYPPPTTAQDNRLEGCGMANPPTDVCTLCGNQFAAGGVDGCQNVYMKQLPPVTDYTWTYQQQDDGDNFCLTTMLDNGSDTDIAKSQAKCFSVCGAPTLVNQYMVCAD
jgi:prepilin-type N-terminal cleavage/methylation domain-containing protein